MLIKCMLDKRVFDKKPDKFETGGIQKRLSQTEIDITELAKLLSNGATFKPALLNGTKSIDWVSQQVFALDFDGGTTIQEQIDKCVEINILPAFGYTSFSYTPEKHKFRLVFIADDTITDINTRNQLQVILIHTFDKSDEVTKDASRLFYGGKNLIPMNYDNRIKADDIINRFYREEYQAEIDDLNEKMTGIKVAKPVKSRAERKGVQDINEFLEYPIISCTPKTPLTQNDTYNIKAIGNRDVDYLKSKYGQGERKIFETNQQFIDYIRKEINLADLLEIKYPNSFRCLFHDDKNPSASIYQNQEGVYLYKCNSGKCGVSYNIIGVIEKLANFKSRPKTYKFIKDIFNLDISETEWQKEQKEILLENLKVLYDGELEENCLQASKNISGIKHYLERLHIIAMNNIYNENLTDNEGNVVFFASADYICKQMGISPNSLNKVSQRIVALAYHKLLNKLDDSEIPDQFLKKSQAININNGIKYSHINWFSIPSYTVNKFPEIRERGEQWKENKYTMKGISREMFFRAEGLEVANELYPQRKKVTENIDGQMIVVDRTTTKVSNIRTDDIVKSIQYLISEYGYANENAIVETLRSKYAYITTQIQIKKSLKEILDSYNLKRIRANKEIKEQYGIISKGYPFIIVRDN